MEVDYVDQNYVSSKRKKYFKIAVLAIFLLYGYFHFFVYWDLGSGCYIKIKPAILEFTNLDIKRALKATKIASPEDYRTVCRTVASIEPMIGCGGFGGGCYYLSGDKKSSGSQITVSTAKNDIQITMAVIVHEACHAIQEKEGRSLGESECYLADDKLLRKIIKM